MTQLNESNAASCTHCTSAHQNVSLRVVGPFGVISKCYVFLHRVMVELHGEGLETTQFTGLRAHQHPVIQRYCGKGVCVCVLWYVGDQTGVLWAYLLTSCIGLNLPLWLSQVVGVFIQ